MDFDEGIFRLDQNQPFALESGLALPGAQIAYATYGTLDAERSNAVLVCHALTGHQYITESGGGSDERGWWSRMVGPGKPIDTDRYFVIGTNLLGGCNGSSGPASVNPETGKSYGIDFPFVTMGDMVRAQELLVREHFGISRLLAVVGGSAGGMQVLKWVELFKDNVSAVMPIATAVAESARNIAIHEVSRQAIMADPEWREGRYRDEGTVPRMGLSVARMAAHINYMAAERISEKFGRTRTETQAPPTSFRQASFSVESYLHHHGRRFVDRFDANTYLYLTKAIDYFDLTCGGERPLAEAFRGSTARFCVISFTTDEFHPPSSSREIVKALNAGGLDVTYSDIATVNGHDAFLLEEPELFDIVENFLAVTKAYYHHG